MANAFQQGYMGNFAGLAGLTQQPFGGLAGALGGAGLQQQQLDAMRARQLETQQLQALPPALSVGPESAITIHAAGPAVRVFATFREELQHEVDKWLAPAHR